MCLGDGTCWRVNVRCVVTVPPRWLVEPTDVSVERNRHVALHCQAQGVPTPTIVWKKATGLGMFVIMCHVQCTCSQDHELSLLPHPIVPFTYLLPELV